MWLTLTHVRADVYVQLQADGRVDDVAGLHPPGAESGRHEGAHARIYGRHVACKGYLILCVTTGGSRQLYSYEMLIYTMRIGKENVRQQVDFAGK